MADKDRDKGENGSEEKEMCTVRRREIHETRK